MIVKGINEGFLRGIKMRGQRMWHTLRLFTILDAGKRTKYYKDNNIFHSIGDNCLIMDRKVPLYAKLISLGNNVRLASDIHFITHDITHSMLNNIQKDVSIGEGQKKPEKVGCIEIGDNVFVGSGTYIMYDVRIGSNVIIGACSLVNKDIPDNCVVAGVPAKIIKTFDEYLEKRKLDEPLGDGIGREMVSPEMEELLWEKFHKKREEE